MVLIGMNVGVASTANYRPWPYLDLHMDRNLDFDDELRLFRSEPGSTKDYGHSFHSQHGASKWKNT